MTKLTMNGIRSFLWSVSSYPKLVRGASKNSGFAQMPHKGTPIRYGQKQPMRSRQQGAEKG